MIRRLSKLLRNESGITALETAIILIAFIVVASVFAFTILSAGTFSTERGKEAIYAGLEEVSSSMETKGSVYAGAASAGATNVSVITFTLGSASGGNPVWMSTTNQLVVIAYRDSDTSADNATWVPRWIIDDGDDLLEDGELIEISIDVSATGVNAALATNEEFTLEIKPPTGGVVNIQRTTPHYLDIVMDLN